MARNDPPNPYMDLRLGELGDALSARAGDLLRGRPAGRRDVAYLLIAAAAVVRPSRGHPNSPAKRVDEGRELPLEPFAAVLEDEQRALRWWVFRQAVDAAARQPAAGGPFTDLATMAVESDAACLEALRRLGEMTASQGT